MISLFIIPYSTIYAYASLSTEFSSELYVFPGQQEMKEVLTVMPAADEETLLYTRY